MKQKIVIEVSINGQKSRKKAMKVAVGLSGVISAALAGDNNKIEVIGEGVDAVELTTMLRKKVGFAELQNVSEVKDKKDDDKGPAAENTVQTLPWSYPYYYGAPIYETCVVPDRGCTIM